jgi:hypothetical protein
VNEMTINGPRSIFHHVTIQMMKMLSIDNVIAFEGRPLRRELCNNPERDAVDYRH